MKTRKIKDVTITTTDGVVLDFGDQASTIEEIAVGMTATIEGGAVPEGSYTMNDGSIWVFAEGVLTDKGSPTSNSKSSPKIKFIRSHGRLKIIAKKGFSRVPGKPILGI